MINLKMIPCQSILINPTSPTVVVKLDSENLWVIISICDPDESSRVTDVWPMSTSDGFYKRFEALKNPSSLDNMELIQSESIRIIPSRSIKLFRNGKTYTLIEVASEDILVVFDANQELVISTCLRDDTFDDWKASIECLEDILTADELMEGTFVKSYKDED